MNGKKKIAVDMLLNIVASAIPVFVLQLLILPSLASCMDADAYGLLVTLLALLNVVPATIGNVLNNIRLIYGNSEENLRGRKADYQVLLLLMALANLIVVAVVSYLYERELSAVSLILTLIVSELWLLREYYIVAFRIKINYTNIVISNLFLVVGYLIGFGAFFVLHRWQIIYILGYLFSLLYIFTRCDLWKESLSISPHFKEITWQTVLLLISGILTRITTYADKLLIFPVLGGAAVSVYYAATLSGKVISLTITPVSSVMLSYLSKAKKKDEKIFNQVFLGSLFLCLIGYFICLALSRPILSLLYPAYVDEAMGYVFLTTGTSVLTALSSVINPFVLSFFDMKWQVSINATYMVVYVALSMSLLSILGLYGFCIGSLISIVTKLLLMLLIYTKCKDKDKYL